MCNSCQSTFVAYGNKKAIVHEKGCPEAYKDTVSECGFCGSEFQPEENGQKFCSTCCYNSYSGFPCDCENCQELYEETDYSGEDNDGFLLEETEEDEL